MSDQETHVEDSEQEPQPEQEPEGEASQQQESEANPWKQVRRLYGRLKEAEHQIETLQQEKLSMQRRDLFRQAGVSDQLAGILDKAYDGEETEEAVQEFIESNGLVQHDLSRQVAQERVRRLRDAGMPIEPASLDDEILQAEKGGDYQLAGRLKAQKLDRMIRDR